METVLQQQVQAAFHDRRKLSIISGNSKAFYGCPVVADQTLNVAGYQGIINYEPSELVLTAKAGTPLNGIEALLAEHHQQFPFEPPNYTGTATLGGAVAAGLSGPARMFSGAVRDAVLGVKIINGKGEVLSFGGQVMKNVAGFDVSRLMVGSLGTLGVLLEVSVKTRPCSACEQTLSKPSAAAEALQQLRQLMHMPINLTASAWFDEQLWLRISGSHAAVNQAASLLDDCSLHDDNRFWIDIKNHHHAFFQQAGDLWRISLPQNAPLAEFPHELMMEWNGALRWLKTTESAPTLHDYARQHQGHACRFNHGDPQHACFPPLEPKLKSIHQKLKYAFDPKNILNDGRMPLN